MDVFFNRLKLGSKAVFDAGLAKTKQMLQKRALIPTVFSHAAIAFTCMLTQMQCALFS